MGRRKLPSLPPQRTEKASEGIPAPIYLTSSAPLYPTESERSAAAQEPSAFTRTKVRANSYSDITRPSSANSILSNADCHSTIDPAIIPGATITGVKPKIRQTSSAVTGGRPAALLAQPTNYKMPTTLARVLLKKELKEALEKRRESLEACEIEANQRQYVVRRMLVSGLLPESRPTEIDDIPNVIPCLLPIELISGANVIPSTSSIPEVSNRYSNDKSCYAESAPSTSKTQSIAISTDKTVPLLMKAKSIGVQVDDPDGSSGLSSPVSIHTFSIAQKDRMHRTPYTSVTTPATTKYVSTETQTENSSGHDKRRNKANTFNSTKRKGGKKISSSDTNLLETTAKYFAEYDRQLREHGRLMRHRFTFADDDPIKRETKKQRLMDELAKRKEKMSSMVDLNTATDFSTDHGVSDYSSTVPHYGSLPRLDYSSSMRPSRYRDDYNYYNSLPRNYERYYDMYDYNCPDYDYMQPSPASGMRPDLLTRSLNDLRLDPEESIIDPRMRSSLAHSLDYLGRPAYAYRDGRFSSPLRRPYPYSRRYASDDLNAQNLHYSDLESGAKPDMISQYANYLSNQFRSDQVEQSLREHQVGASLFPSNSSTNVPSSSRLIGPMSDPYPPYRGCAQQRIPPYTAPLYSSYDPAYQDTILPNSVPYGQRMYEKSVPYGPYGNRTSVERYSATYPSTLETQDYLSEMQPNAYMSTSEYGPDPLYSRELSQVYSRNEANYGSKPLQTATDYGNFYRNRQPPTGTSIDPYSGYANENYPGAPMQETYHQPFNISATNYSAYPQSQQNIGNADLAGPSFSNAPSRYNRSNMFNIPQTSYGHSQSNNNNNNNKRYGRSWPLTNFYDESYPQEDALTRIYASASSQYRAPPSQRLADINNRNHASSLGRYDRKQRRNDGRPVRETQSAHGSEESDTSYEGGKSSIPVRRKNIKRILLTRRYRDSNVYSDLGIRITGGKKLRNGELGAFVSAVNKERACETLGEIKEGDQVLEWNGVILTGKTFEEVERIINSSQGEIELVVKSGAEECDGSREKRLRSRSNNNYELSNNGRRRSGWNVKNDELDGHIREAPPIPTHRCVDGRASPSFDVYPSLSVHSDPAPAKLVTKTYRSSGSDPHSLGYINIAVSYNYRSSALRVTVLSARGLSYRQHSSKTFYPNPFVKIYLLPGREVCNKRRTKFVSNTADPVWNQIVEYNIPLRDLRSHYLEFTVWDYDRLNDNNSLGQVIISLSEPSLLDGTARWYPLQSMHNNFAVTGLPSSHFQNVIGNYTNGFVQNTYNPASLDIGYPVIN